MYNDRVFNNPEMAMVSWDDDPDRPYVLLTAGGVYKDFSVLSFRFVDGKLVVGEFD